MQDNYVITIARGFGSGGKEIGKKVAERLGIPCYEKQILTMASEQSGLSESLFAEVDERLRSKNIFKKMQKLPFHEMLEPNMEEFTSDVNLFQIQAEIIRNLAWSTSCVIVGKCADYILKDYYNTVSFYIEAPRQSCVDSIMHKMQVSEMEANRLIEKTDKYRADYYKYYTEGNLWTNPINYDMTLNSARVGRERCVDIIENYVKSKFPNKFQ